MTLSACGDTVESSTPASTPAQESTSVSTSTEESSTVTSSQDSSTLDSTTVIDNSSVEENSSVMDSSVINSSVEDNSSVQDNSSVMDSSVINSSVEDSSVTDISSEDNNSSVEEIPNSSVEEDTGLLDAPIDTVFEFEDAEHYAPNGWNGQNGGLESPVEDATDEDGNPTSGGKSVGYQSAGCTETFNFTSKATGKAKVTFRMAPTILNSSFSGIDAMDLSAVITISVNGVNLDLTGKTLEGVDGWSWFHWQNIEFDNVDLQKGGNSIVLTVIASQGPNLDCMIINTNCILEGGTAGGGTTTPEEQDFGSAFYVIHGYCWGPGVDKVVLCLNGDVLSSDLSADLFSVKSTGSTGGAREVTAAYLADANGDQVTATSARYVALDLKLDVTSQTWGNFTFNSYNGCDPFSYSQQTSKNTWDTAHNVEVTLAAGKTFKVGDKAYTSADKFKLVAPFSTKVIPDLKDWSEAKSYTHTASGKTLTYKAYEPATLTSDGVKDQLIIWLHGAGEGGTDPDIALLGNDVTNLSQDNIQQYFKKTGGAQGAYVLAVQTPTMWMDDGTGNYTTNGNSCYTAALKATIDDYLTKNTDIDKSKILLGGCSNGGYMTMNMALNYPSFFHAYYPVCEAYADQNITTENITTLKDLKMWFTAAATDTTVDPSGNASATFKRLKAAGGSDIHYSFFEKVMCDESGQDIEYMGHYSWIYTLRNDCTKDQADPENIAAPSTADVKLNNKAVSLWEWLANI